MAKIAVFSHVRGDPLRKDFGGLVGRLTMRPSKIHWEKALYFSKGLISLPPEQLRGEHLNSLGCGLSDILDP
jgi:hypothetical protein